MRCPNRKCRQETPKLVVKFDKKGKKYEGCPACIASLGVTVGTPHLYSGRKFWGGDEVYGVEGNKEKAHEFEKEIAQKAAMNRRRPPLNTATIERLNQISGR